MRVLNFSKLKPGVNRSKHLLVAAILWSCVGIMLMVRGWFFFGETPEYWMILLAVVVGSAKSHLILDKSFKSNMQRILKMKDGTCLGAVYSWKLWALVIVMVLSGYILRTVNPSGILVGTLYFAIGWGLFLSSRHGWLGWFRLKE